MDAYPDAFTNSISDAEKIKKIAEIKGMATKTAEAFVAKIDDFLDFLTETDMFYKLNTNKKKNKEENIEVNKEHPLFGKTVVITGFRNKELEEKLKNIGAKIGTSVSKNTHLVIAKDKDDETSKVLDAKKLGVNVVSLSCFGFT